MELKEAIKMRDAPDRKMSEAKELERFARLKVDLVDRKAVYMQAKEEEVEGVKKETLKDSNQTSSKGKASKDCEVGEPRKACESSEDDSSSQLDQQEQQGQLSQQSQLAQPQMGIRTQRQETRRRKKKEWSRKKKEDKKEAKTHVMNCLQAARSRALEAEEDWKRNPPPTVEEDHRRFRMSQEHERKNARRRLTATEAENWAMELNLKSAQSKAAPRKPQ